MGSEDGSTGLEGALTKWLLYTALAVLLTMSAALLNRNVYSKEEVDQKITRVEQEHRRDMDELAERLSRIDENVQSVISILLKGER